MTRTCVFDSNGEVYYDIIDNRGVIHFKRLGNVLTLIQQGLKPLTNKEKAAFDYGFALDSVSDHRKVFWPGFKSHIDKFEQAYHAEPYDRRAIYAAFAELKMHVESNL